MDGNSKVKVSYRLLLLEVGETEKLMDASLNGDFNVEEAIRFCKIVFLCIQDYP